MTGLFSGYGGKAATVSVGKPIMLPATKALKSCKTLRLIRFFISIWSMIRMNPTLCHLNLRILSKKVFHELMDHIWITGAVPFQKS